MRRLALLLVAALALAACGGDDEEAAAPAGSDADVEELSNVLDLRADFEADAGKTRLIVLLSPT